MRIPQHGEVYRVKCIPILERYGIRCRHGDYPFDNRVWPRERGTVEVYSGNGWQEMLLTFPRGRTIELGTLYRDIDTWELSEGIMSCLIRCR